MKIINARSSKVLSSKVLSRTVLTLFMFFTLLSTPLQARDPYNLPEFTQTTQKEWLNSKPLSRKDLLGKVSIIEFWTYSCWNCYRSFPWLHSVETKFKPKGFQVIGIHSPEFEVEKAHANIIAKMKGFKITNPVMVDNDMAFWKKMKNQYWPAYYIVDKKGKVRARFIGETHKDSPQGNKIEALIETLLTE